MNKVHLQQVLLFHDLFELEAKEVFSNTKAVSDGDEYEIFLNDSENGD